MQFTEDISLDAVLVHAAMNGLFVPCAIGLDMKPDEAYGRAEWLKKQSDQYIKKVSDKVVEIEQKAAK